MGKKRKRQRRLDAAVAGIQRRYGPQSLYKGPPPRAGGGGTAPHVATGFPALDQALGIGGLPRGQLCELLGPATSGKTTLALKFLAQAQAALPRLDVAYIDQAGYFDPDYAHRCGLDLSRFLVGRPADLRETLAMTEALLHSGTFSVLVLDALDFFWTEPGMAAQLAAVLGRVAAPLARSQSILLFLHEPPAGGSAPLSALAHYAGVRLQVVRERWVYGPEPHRDVRGYEVRVEVLKNRVGRAGQIVKLAIKFNGTVYGNGL